MNRNKKKRILFQGFLVIVFIALAGIDYYFYQYLQQLTATVQKQTETMKRAMSPLQQQLNSLNQSQEDLKTQIQAAASPSANQWLLLEVQNLVWMANDKLRFSNDIETAQKLLETAKQRLSATEELNTVKSALDQDLTTLQQTPRLDKQQMMDKIQSIKSAIAGLQFKNLDTQKVNPALAYFDGLIKITREDQNPVAVALSQQEKAQVLQLLQLMVDQMQWALLQQKTDVIQANYQAIVQHLQQYFAENESFNTIMQSLETLKEQKNVITPDISATLQAIEGAQR